MKIYETPQAVLLNLSFEDVIRTSGFQIFAIGEIGAEDNFA